MINVLADVESALRFLFVVIVFAYFWISCLADAIETKKRVWRYFQFGALALLPFCFSDVLAALIEASS